MKILKPIRFDGTLDKGGSTKPWMVSCVDAIAALEEIPCVLKLFTPTHVTDTNCIGKEYVGSVLAGEFDLVVPDAYIIDAFDPDFVETLEANTKKDLATRFKGKSFGSKFVNAAILNPHIKTTNFSIHDCAMVFAFDCLIVNQDRGGYRNKPNLMVNDDGLILIDHELSFHFTNGDSVDAYKALMDNFANNNWSPVYQTHVFFQQLKTYRGSKKGLFDTFEEYLYKLDVNVVVNAIAELEESSITLGQKNLLIDYLYTLKQEAHKFCRILLSLIA